MPGNAGQNLTDVVQGAAALNATNDLPGGMITVRKRIEQSSTFMAVSVAL